MSNDQVKMSYDMIKTVFQNLRGDWTFFRSIPKGDVKGTARFTEKNPHELHYREDGVMRIDGQPHTVYREYVYRLEEGSICTFFPEEPLRLFQYLEFDKKDQYPIRARGSHLCGCDLYLAEYEFSSNKRFSQEQKVKGPKKDFLIRTTFEKVVP